MKLIESIALDREQLHATTPSSRPLSDGYESVGLHGEFAFGTFSGQMPDITERPKGDAGVDFVVPILFTVDVKTARKAFNLIHETGKPFADIYVLAEYDDHTSSAKLIGWEFGSRLASSPTRDFGYGILNHYIPRDSLRSMASLGQRIWRAAK